MSRSSCWSSARRALLARCRSTIAASLVLASSPLVAVEYEWTMTPPPSGLSEARFRLWIPDDLPAVRPVRGIIGASDYHAGAGVYQTKAGEPWADLALRRDLAILKYTLNTAKGLDTSVEGAKAIGTALEQFALQAKRPELAHAGLIPTGLSWGAAQVCQYTKAMPERIIAAMPFRATARDLERCSDDKTRLVPLLHVSAGRETFANYVPLKSHVAMPPVVAAGARWAMLVQPRGEHHQLTEPADVGFRFALAWLETVVALRVPDKITPGKPLALRDLPLMPACVATFTVIQDGDHQRMDQARAVVVGKWPKGVTMADGLTGQRPEALLTWLPTQELAVAWTTYANDVR